MTVNCSYCKEEFQASLARIAQGHNLHCSRKCANLNRPKNKRCLKIELECLFCRKSFRVKKSRFEKNNPQFCSKKCYGKFKSENQTTSLKCDICNKDFIAKNCEVSKGNRRFCSERCRLKKPKSGENINCSICGKLFYVEKYRKNSSRYCSNECRNIGAKKQVKVNCYYCNKEFFLARSWITRKDRKFLYCSKECSFKKKRTGKILNCPICEKEFYVTLGKLKKNKKSFCSRKCSGKWNSGEKSRAWRGGVTSELKKLRDSPQYKDWRKLVFQRDNYTCQDCTSRNGKGYTVYLEAHHLKSFKHFPESRFDIDNGITLCKKCHKERHKKPK